ncbi:hypothetical protein JCM10213v2_003156 [Rhodosporidiobolus nylandii]
MASDAQEIADKPLAGHPALPHPPLPSLTSPTPSDLHLDELSLRHVERLCEQSLKACKVSTDYWRRPLLDVLRQFEATLTPEVLEKLALSKAAEAEAAAMLAQTKKVDGGEGVERLLGGIWGVQSRRGRSEQDEDAEQAARERRRARWREAASLLPSKSSEDGHGRGHARDTSIDSWTEVSELPHVSVLHVHLDTVETTLGAVRSGAASFSATFVQGEWKGQPLFGQEEPDLDDDDLKLVDRLGGTFSLTATARDAPRLERVLELLAFAVISLKLEVHLLADLSCPHPPPEPDLPPLPSAAETPSPTSHEGEDTVAHLPGSVGRVDLHKFATEDWRMPRRVRTSFSAFSANDWLQLISPHPTPPGAQSKRRNSKKRVLSKSFSIAAPSQSSSVPSSPTVSSHAASPETTPDKRRHGSRAMNKIKGFGEQLKLRRKAPKEPDLSMRKVATIDAPGARQEEKGWLGGLNIGLGGLGRGSPKEEKPQHEKAKAKIPSPTTSTAATEADQEEKQPLRFEKVVQELAQFVLSVSPDVLYPPPHLLFRLRQQELDAAEAEDEAAHSERPSTPPSGLKPFPQLSPPNPPRLPSSPSYFSLASDALARKFAGGTPDVSDRKVSAQTLAAPPSSGAARITLDVKAGLASLLTNNSSLDGSMRHQSMQFLIQTVCNDAPPGALPCRAPRWTTFAFYAHLPHSHKNPSLAEDSTLAAVIEQLVAKKDELCAASQCSKPNSKHSLVFLHGKERLEVSLAALEGTGESEGKDDEEKKQISTWTTCKTCHAMTTPKPLSAAAGSYSFSKLDPNLVPLPDLCAHASEDREALVRNFAIGKAVVEIRLGSIALFELRLPTAVDPDVEPDEEDEMKPVDSMSVHDLKNEIAAFFSSLDNRLDALEDRLAPLPSTPPSGEPLEGTPTRHRRISSADTIIENGGDTAKEEKDDSILSQLHRLRTLLRAEEAACLTGAEEVSPLQLNNARFIFESRAKAFKLRLLAWEKKHSEALKAGPGPELPADLELDEPEYFGKEVHAFPVDSPILVRDGELSSLIALALSAGRFHEAVASVASGYTSRIVTPSTASSGFPSDVGSRHPSRGGIPSEFLNAGVSTLSTTPSSARSNSPPRSPLRGPGEQLDPDDPDADFTCRGRVEDVVAKPRKPPASGTGSMFRRLVAKKSHESIGLSPAATPTLASGPFGGADVAEKRISRAVPLSDTVLTDLITTRESSPATPRPGRPPPKRVPSFMKDLATRREGSTPTMLSDVRATADVSDRSTPVPRTASGTMRSITSLTSLGSTAPTSDCAASLASFASGSETSVAPSSASTTSSVADSSNGNDDEVPPLHCPAPQSGSRLLNLPGKVGGLLDSFRSSPRLAPADSEAEMAAVQSSEHIKFKFREGSKRYRVTAYYARRFQALRAKCGLSENLFVESLSRCTDLNPSGGKSSAAFLMTGDKRFILKELVTKFGHSELDTLLHFTPNLLDYLMKPERPSLLAKIFGVYTVKIVDAKSGEKRKLDLFVMEHLFFNVSVSRRFDLKGIASRGAKPKPGAEAKEETGWDSDWLTGSLRDQLLIYPHSKTLLRDALANDVEFLSSNGGIDFSLLVGVDDTNSELVVGLIDTLGGTVFNSLKVLEHRAKSAVAADRDAVTVQPPSEYAKRFLTAMETYFVAVPDKWTRPPGTDADDPAPRLACPL